MTRPLLPLTVLLLLAACSGGGPGKATSTESESPSQAPVEWTIHRNEALGTPSHVVGRWPRALRPGFTPVSSVHGFLAEHRELFGIATPERELALVRSEVSESGTHVRLQQVVGGVPVQGAELAAHFDREGALTSIDARYVPGLEFDQAWLTPSLGASEAEEVARREVLLRTPELHASDLSPPRGELVVSAEIERGGEPRLAWHVVIRGSGPTVAAVLDATVDARTGELLGAFDDLETIAGTGTGVLGDTKQLQVTESGGTYTLVDKSRGAEVRTYTAQAQQILPGNLVSGTNPNAWDNVTNGRGAAVDAHFFAGVVYDYYKTKFARNGLDGKNSPMLSTAHFGQNFENAFWDGTQMAYGDGASRFRALSAGLDVVGHEFTHGVTSSTSKLEYQGQPGALNEAISDIFSSFIEHSFKPDDTNNWLTGEVVGINGPIRSLSNPRSKGQPSHMKEYVNTQQDNGGVHINSGIPNNAAYLMTMGGQNPYSKIAMSGKLGWEKSEKLWYELETKYLLSRSNFSAAASASTQAAKALNFSASEQAIVTCAWIAVGVVNGTCESSPTPLPPVDAGPPDSAPPPPKPTPQPAPDSGPPAQQPPGEGLLLTPRDDSGCNQTGASAGVDLGTLATGALAFLGLATSRRRKKAP